MIKCKNLVLTSNNKLLLSKEKDENNKKYKTHMKFNGFGLDKNYDSSKKLEESIITRHSTLEKLKDVKQKARFMGVNENVATIKFLYSLDESVRNILKIVDNELAFVSGSQALKYPTYSIHCTTMDSLFAYYDEDKLDLRDFFTKNVKSMRCMFEFSKASGILVSKNFDTSNVEDIDCIFLNSTNLDTVDISFLKLSKLKSMGRAFESCHKLSTINIDNLDLPELNTLYSLFRDCTAIESIDIRGLNAPKLNSVMNMFNKCSNLRRVVLRDFNTKQVKDYSGMFEDCIELRNVDLSSFDTRQGLSFEQMFLNCKSLKKLDLSNFRTDRAVTIYQMFKGCKELVELNILNFDPNTILSKQRTLQNKFSTIKDCDNLKHIICNNPIDAL